MAKVVATKPRTAAGGVVAPKSAAKGPTTGLGNNTAINPNHPNYVPRPVQRQRGIPAPVQPAPPAPAAPPAYAPAPWDSAEQLTDAGADAKYNNALLNLGYKKQAYETEYGFDPGYNDFKANPFSRAALLEESYQRANRATGTSLGAAGQLYSGAHQNAETYSREHDVQERNSLERAYRAALQGITEEEASALGTREEEKAAARWKALEAAQNAPLEPDAAPSPYGEQAGGVLRENKKTKKKIGISGARKAR